MLGRYNGKVVFVNANGLEGELVDIQIVEEKKDYIVGKILNIQESSIQRVSSICKYGQLCGGCQWQHIDYSAQLKFKEQILLEQLTRIGGFKQPHIMPVIGMENPWEYRSRSRFILKTVANGFSLGFYQAGTKNIVDIDYCHLLSQEMNEGYVAVRNAIATRLNKFHAHCAVEIRHFEGGTSDNGVMVFFVTSPEFHLPLSAVARELQDIPVIKGVHQLVVDKNQSPILETYFGPSIFTYSLEGLSFQAQPTSFFQINLGQAQRLFSEALRLLLPQKNQQILDGHCGVGVLSLLAAREAKGVVGIDVATTSISDAEKNSQNNGIKNVQFLCNDLKQAVSMMTTPQFDSVILNPPRDGVEKHTLHWLLETKPAKIVYVSCNPTTLSRDMKILCQGGYSLTVVQPVDMFPQTYHVESIALLESV